MKRLVSTQDLARYLNKTASDAMGPHIDFAHALVEAEIGGSIQERTVRMKTSFPYDIGAGEWIPLSDGPMVSLSSLTIDGTDAETLDSNGESENITLRPWSIRRYSGFSSNGLIVFTGTAGWTPANVPLTVREALIQTGALLHKHPDQSALMEKIGDYMIQRGSLTGSGDVPAIPAQARFLLRGFKKL